MSIDNILLTNKDVSFDKMIPLSEIRTDAEKERLNASGYVISYTESEFLTQFPEIDSRCVWYLPCISAASLYYNPRTMAASLMLLERFVNKGSTSSTFSKDSLVGAILEAEKQVTEGNYRMSITILPDAMRLEYLIRLAKSGKQVANIYSMFIKAYTTSDYGFSRLDPDDIRLLCETKSPEDTEATKKRIDALDLPDIITVYRGGNSKSTDRDKAFSWTTDINVANFFAIRRGGGPGYIASGTIKKENIIEAFISSEREVIIDPENVSFGESIELLGVDYLIHHLPNVASSYQFYTSRLNLLNADDASAFHGRPHEARVLLLSLLISDAMGLPSAERKVLATAAIYHDSMRCSDGEAPCHGADSQKYYMENETAPDPVVGFLIKYHCLPDTAAYDEINHNRELSKNGIRTKLLYDLFCDCDSLDRIRLPGGVLELDMNQIRLDISKRFTLIAKILLQCLD